MQHGGAAETPAARGASPPALDWGAGHYESTAAQILPAARTVVQLGRGYRASAGRRLQGNRAPVP